jgi:hypothetical protein
MLARVKRTVIHNYKPDEYRVEKVYTDMPEIVCLCGSVRFSEAFQKAQKDETLRGNIVLTIGCNMKSDTELFGDMPESTLKIIKEKLDELHKRKIDLADRVKILNVEGYIGSSTKNELIYSKEQNKKIEYLEPSGAPYIRDPEAPCNGYEPKQIFGDYPIPECQTDGHYMCEYCRFKAPQTKEEAEEINANLR